VFFAEVLPRHSVSAPLLARLLAVLLTGAAIESAAEGLRTPFALETFHRIVRRLRRRLDAVRACLCRERAAPASEHADPLLQTIAHLHAVFGDGSGAVAAFQKRFGRAFLG